MERNDPSFKQSRGLIVRYKELIFLLVLIAAFSLFRWTSNSNGVSFDWGEEATTVTDPAGDSFTIQYPDLLSMTLEECAEFGQCLSGESRWDWVYGTWENDRWGTYRLLATPRADLCIVFRTEQSCYVLSYESDETTRKLYEALLPIVEAAQP